MVRVRSLFATLWAAALSSSVPLAARANEDPADGERPEPTRVAASLEGGSCALALEVPWALRSNSAVAHGSPKLVGSWTLASPEGSTWRVGGRSEVELHTERDAVSLGDSTATTALDLRTGLGPVALGAALGPRLGRALEWTYEASIAVETTRWLTVGAKVNGVSDRRLDAHEAFAGASVEIGLADDLVVSTFAGRGARTEPYVLPNWMVWSGATLPL